MNLLGVVVLFRFGMGQWFFFEMSRFVYCQQKDAVWITKLTRRLQNIVYWRWVSRISAANQNRKSINNVC